MSSSESIEPVVTIRPCHDIPHEVYSYLQDNQLVIELENTHTAERWIGTFNAQCEYTNLIICVKIDYF
jgi:hypothetical protein